MYLFKLVFLFSLDIYPWVEYLGHTVVQFLAFFWETSILFSKVTVPVHFPISSVQGFPFLYILTNICYLYSFVDGHSERGKVVVLCLNFMWSLPLHFALLLQQNGFLSHFLFLKLLYSSYHNICYFPKWRKTLDQVGDSNLTINCHPSPISVSNHRTKHNASSTPCLT